MAVCRRLALPSRILWATHITRHSPCTTAPASTAAAPLEFKGQSVVVTGGADGIGAAVCRAFVAAGANVVCGDVSEALGAALSESVRGSGAGTLHFHRFDAADADDTRGLVQEAADRFGGVDVLVNNVGVQHDNGVSAHELDDSVWAKVMAVNVTSYFVACKAALSLSMLPRGRGAIVNMASVQGMLSQPGVPAYASSKGAILSFTRQLAVDYGRRGIRVNAVSPGTIRTPLVERNIAERGWKLENAADPYPVGYIGEPSDVADTVLYLSSHDRARFVTGANFVVDGGITSIGGWASHA